MCADPATCPAAKPCACELIDVRAVLGPQREQAAEGSLIPPCLRQQGAAATTNISAGRPERLYLWKTASRVRVGCAASATAVGGNSPPADGMRRLVSIGLSVPWVLQASSGRAPGPGDKALPLCAAHQPHAPAPQPDYTLTLLKTRDIALPALLPSSSMASVIAPSVTSLAGMPIALKQVCMPRMKLHVWPVPSNTVPH